MLPHSFCSAVALVLCALLATACSGTDSGSETGSGLPAEIATIMGKPRYANAESRWSLAVIDVKTGELVYALEPDRLSLTGSVRKLFSVGTALNTLGASHRFETPVYRTGAVDAQGLLAGDLVLVASGDLTFGGRIKPDGLLAYTDFNHNEADSFGGSG